jgi:signal transduction histidine kinase
LTAIVKERGMGLELSVSYGIVINADERIKVRHKVGKESTFRVNLPAAAEPLGGMIDG